MSTLNRRKAPRVAWSVPVTYEAENKKTERCRSVDVSSGGTLLSVNEPLKPGSRLKVKFQIDGYEIGPEYGRVIRNDSAFGGTEFWSAVEFDSPRDSLLMAIEYDKEKKAWLRRKSLDRTLHSSSRA